MNVLYFIVSGGIHVYLAKKVNTSEMIVYHITSD